MVIFFVCLQVFRRRPVMRNVIRSEPPSLFMDTSPYASPILHPDSSMPSATRLLDTLCFVINFAFATLFFMACVISIGAADNPFAFIGGFLFVLPVACYAIAEWLCWYRRRYWLFRPLGILNLLLAAFFVFGLVTNVGEAFIAEDPIDPLFLLFFGLGFAVVAGYLAWCGWRRIHTSATSSDAIPDGG